MNPYDCITDFIYADHPPEEADMIVIPGSDHLPLARKAAELYHNGFAARILVTGGQPAHMQESEWSFLSRELRQLGVPDDALIKEDKALNTFENAVFAKEAADEKGIPYRRLLIPAKASHARRVLLTFQARFPADTECFIVSVPDRGGVTALNWMYSEAGIERTMLEVEKIGRYFKQEVGR
ncbi:YdcF family protein [Bacillus daqingensis]|uniref:YdcF family protein n=1 Tax=Bacillus daqingensis TaxID=872396 RepID=A0ABV9NUJ5_9BACI